VALTPLVAWAAPQGGCSITKVTYVVNSTTKTVNVIDVPNSDYLGASIPANATQVKVWGTFGPTNVNTTVQGTIAEWDGSQEVTGTKKDLTITKVKDNAGVETGAWYAPITVTAGKVYMIKAKATKAPNSWVAKSLMLNVANNNNNNNEE
jgi:hypothetical protein